jgi:hypothetical protein
MATMIEDFSSTLTVHEQEFLEEHLLGQSEGDRRDLSEASFWQLCHRVRAKLNAFFGGND